MAFHLLALFPWRLVKNVWRIFWTQQSPNLGGQPPTEATCTLHHGPRPFHPIQLKHPNGRPRVGSLQKEGQMFNLCLRGLDMGNRNVLKDAGFQYLKTNQDGSAPATGDQTVDWQVWKADADSILRCSSLTYSASSYPLPAHPNKPKGLIKTFTSRCSQTFKE